MLLMVQMALVYVNTLMIQEVLGSPTWAGRLTPEDLRGLTPLIFSHVNPYGTFLLDMDERIPLEAAAIACPGRSPDETKQETATADDGAPSKVGINALF